eukprot:GEMP01045843.1.p1 GENE.GEMP01045843.1~~GEMP01045843.1.p1  ORF type:complete len:175 (+),score=35.51 GEMP01045843.1:445-969(+)
MCFGCSLSRVLIYLAFLTAHSLEVSSNRRSALVIDKDAEPTFARDAGGTFLQRLGIVNPFAPESQAQKSHREVHEYVERMMALNPNPEINWKAIDYNVRMNQLSQKMPRRIRIATLIVICVTLCGILYYYVDALNLIRRAEMTSQEKSQCDEDQIDEDQVDDTPEKDEEVEVVN